MTGKAAVKEVKIRNKNRKRWEIRQVLHVDNTMLMAESREDLQHIADEFERGCDRMKLKIYLNTTKVLVDEGNYT